MGRKQKVNSDVLKSKTATVIDFVDIPAILPIEVSTDANNKKTASKAVKILTDLNKGFKEPTKTERTNLLVAFAKKHRVL